MRKLPINFFLYVISLGTAAGSGLLFYQALQVGRGEDSITQRWNEGKKLLAEGGQTPVKDRNWDYSNAPWWKQLQAANYTGKLPPQPEVEKPKETEKTKPSGMTPIDDILSVISILSDGAESKAIVRYKPGANVQVPPELMASRFAGRDVVAAPAGARPSTGAQVPAFNPNDPPLHHVLLEQTLWKPHDNIRLVKVEADAKAVWFLREDPSKPPEEWKQERVLKNELEMPPKILEELMKGSGMPLPGQGDRKSSSPALASANAWHDVPETKELEPGQWMISKKDDAYLEENMHRLINDDVYVEPYRSRMYSGLMFSKVSQDVQRFGVQQGDVLVSLNGQPVTEKVQAMKVGRELYERGTRTFTAEVIRAGRKVSINWTLPNK